MRSYWLPERKAISSARREKKDPGISLQNSEIVGEAWIFLRVRRRVVNWL